MKIFINKLYISLLLIFVYELFMLIFNFTGVTASKVFVTGFLWISVIICIGTFLKNYRQFRKSIPKLAFNTILLIIIWNLINIVRSLFIADGAITSLFGNINTSLALLVPFFIIFSIKTENIRRLNNYFIILFKIGILLFILFFVTEGGILNITQFKILNLFFFPVTFLITIVNFQRKKEKIIIFLVVLLLMYIAFGTDSRTSVLRELLLIISLIALFFYRKFFFKWILKVTFLILLVPFIFIQSSISTGQSAIKQNLSSISDQELSSDTRTFLYTEVFEDLLINDALIFGKGANGTYYSDFFNQTGGDTDTRLTVEVGVLAILLKGGLIGLLFYFLILYTSIYYAFFRSNNFYVVGIGFMLIIYSLILFIQNSISYSSHNIYIWFFIGICLSKEMRNMSNPEIKALLLSKKV